MKSALLTIRCTVQRHRDSGRALRPPRHPVHPRNATFPKRRRPTKHWHPAPPPKLRPRGRGPNCPPRGGEQSRFRPGTSNPTRETRQWTARLWAWRTCEKPLTRVRQMTTLAAPTSVTGHHPRKLSWTSAWTPPKPLQGQFLVSAIPSTYGTPRGQEPHSWPEHGPCG